MTSDWTFLHYCQWVFHSKPFRLLRWALGRWPGFTASATSLCLARPRRPEPSPNRSQDMRWLARSAGQTTSTFKIDILTWAKSQLCEVSATSKNVALPGSGEHAVPSVDRPRVFRGTLMAIGQFCRHAVPQGTRQASRDNGPLQAHVRAARLSLRAQGGRDVLPLGSSLDGLQDQVALPGLKRKASKAPDFGE